VAAGTSEALNALAPPPSDSVSAEVYRDREIAFLNGRGWWPSAQLVLNSGIDLDTLDSISEDRFRIAVENSHRLRIVLAFADGVKPDHTVIWDRDRKEVVFDPALGVVPIAKLFDDHGSQTYSGTLGFTAYKYQPGNPIQTLIKHGIVPIPDR
jgi:hypothetical protein